LITAKSGSGKRPPLHFIPGKRGEKTLQPYWLIGPHVVHVKLRQRCRIPDPKGELFGYEKGDSSPTL